MPDGDIFSNTVASGWVIPSRLSFSTGDDAIAISECEKALARDLNAQPWADLPDAVQVVAEAGEAGSDVMARRHMLKDFERYRDTWPADRYEAMCRVANRILTRETTADRLVSSLAIWEERRGEIAAEVFAELIIIHVAPACTATRLAQSGKMDEPRFQERSAELRSMLRNAPGVARLADLAMQTADKSGRTITPSRSRLPRLPQVELVELPIG